jgi:hypothetical protein
VSGERIEGEIEPVARKEREASRGQALSERVDDPMCHVLRAGGRVQAREESRVRGSMASHIQSTCFELRSLVRSLVQLKVREPEMARWERSCKI